MPSAPRRITAAGGTVRTASSSSNAPSKKIPPTTWALVGVGVFLLVAVIIIVVYAYVTSYTRLGRIDADKTFVGLFYAVVGAGSSVTGTTVFWDAARDLGPNIARQADILKASAVTNSADIRAEGRVATETEVKAAARTFTSNPTSTSPTCQHPGWIATKQILSICGPSITVANNTVDPPTAAVWVVMNTVSDTEFRTIMGRMGYLAYGTWEIPFQSIPTTPLPE
jgi:hypothetical protein